MPTGTINLTPNTPALDGTHLNWLIARYLDSCRQRLDHRITSDGYSYQLRWFVEWWDINGPARAWMIRQDDFALFERHLRSAISPATKRKLSYHTRHTIVKRLKEMFRWAHDHGYVDRYYGNWVPIADGGPPKRRAARVRELHALLEAAGTGYQTLRDRAIVAMLMGMGLRRAELSNINVENVVVEADHSGYAAVTGKRTKANRTGERDAAFDSPTGVILVAYLDTLTRTQGPLFTGQRGDRLTGQGIYKVVKNAITRAALDGIIIGPHDLRRAFATHYRRNRGANGDLLQRQLGHSSYEQTNEYTLLDIDDVRAGLISPLQLFKTVPEDEDDR